MSKAVEAGKALIAKMNECMTTIESCEVFVACIKEGGVVAVDGNDTIVDVLEVLTEDQMQFLADKMCDMILETKADAESFLDEITQPKPEQVEEKRKAAIIDKEFDDAINDMISKAQARADIKAVMKNNGFKKPGAANFAADHVEIDRMKADGCSWEKIAEVLGYEDPKLTGNRYATWKWNEANKKHLESAPKKAEPKKEKSDKTGGKKAKVPASKMYAKPIPDTEETRRTIRALYTTGPFDMKKLADEFTADVKEMHAYCVKHNLLKPVKK